MSVQTPREYIEEVIEKAHKRDRHQPEFLQAVDEVLNNLTPVLEEHPEYIEAKVLTRLIEPERQIMFRVAWTDDQNEINVSRGYRIQYSSALGPYKGGIRFHPSVNVGIIKFLGFEQIFKNALTRQGIGAGKGGADFDPRGKSEAEVMRFCQSYMTELFRHIGEQTDVPAGDMGVSGREIGYLFGQYRRLSNRYESGVLTGKGTLWGGAEVRREATGYGAVYFAEQMLARAGMAIHGSRVTVSGSGNVAIYAAEKISQLGGKTVAVSDSGGYIVDEEGIDIDILKQVKEVDRARISEYVKHKPSARYIEGGSIWDVPVDYAFPCATQNELLLSDAKELIKNGVKAVVEGANMPTTPDAIELLRSAGVLFAPGKAANAGGVATSALEMSQNAARSRWDFDKSESRLHAIMRDVHDSTYEASERYGSPGDYILGANSASFVMVADAMIAQGVS